MWSSLDSNFYTFSDFITGFKVVHIYLKGHKFGWYRCTVISIKCLCARCFLGKHISHACSNYVSGCTGSLLLRGLLSSCGSRASHCGGFPCGARAPGGRSSVAATHGLSCSVACRIFLAWGLNPCPLGRRILNYWTTRKAPHACSHMCAVCVYTDLHT